MTREQLFAAPKRVRQAEERLARGKVAVSAARARATEIAQQSAPQPRLPPNGLQRRRLERLNGCDRSASTGSAESRRGLLGLDNGGRHQFGAGHGDPLGHDGDRPDQANCYYDRDTDSYAHLLPSIMLSLTNGDSHIFPRRDVR